MLSHSVAVIEATARFGEGTSRFKDFMEGWYRAASTPVNFRNKSMTRHGTSVRHRKRTSHF